MKKKDTAPKRRGGKKGKKRWDGVSSVEEEWHKVQNYDRGKKRGINGRGRAGGEGKAMGETRLVKGSTQARKDLLGRFSAWGKKKGIYD